MLRVRVTMRAPRPFLAAVAGLAAGWLVACGAAPQKSAAPPAATESTAGVGGGRPSDEIRRLDEEITVQMADLGLAPPSQTELTEMVVAHATPALPAAGTTAASACEPPPTEPRCQDACTLADSICANAARICELAAELPHDGWAQERCASGKASCDRARTRCCAC